LTFLRLAGVKNPELRQPFDGLEIWDAISKKAPSPRHELLIAYDETGLLGGRKAYRSGFWKIMINPTNAANLKQNHSLIEDLMSYKLFNLEKDPTEQNNVILENVELAEKLKRKMESYGPGKYYRTLIFDWKGSNPDNFGGFWSPWLNDSNSYNSSAQEWDCETVCSFNHIPLLFYFELTRYCPMHDSVGAWGESRDWRKDFKTPPYFRTPKVSCGHDIPVQREMLESVFIISLGPLVSFFLAKWFFSRPLSVADKKKK